MHATQTSPADGALATCSEDGPILSKKAQKRLVKAQRREEQKKERRAREKEAKAAKKAAKRERERERSTAATGADADTGRRGEDGERERTRKRRKLVDGEGLSVCAREEGAELEGEEGSEPDTKPSTRQIRKEQFGAKVVIDLGFDEKMTDRVSRFLSPPKNA